MKKMIGLMVTILLVIGITACSAASSTGGTGNNTTTSGQKALTTADELLVGTLKLEGTSQAVDKTQAATLLTLWQAYKELQSNNSAATEEVNAVASQIQGTMTSDQMKAIDDLKLTSQDTLDTLTSLGITTSPVSSSATQTAPSRQDFGGGLQGDPGGGGAVVVGVPPSGGGGPQGGGIVIAGGSSSGTTNLSQSQIATMQASKGTGNNVGGSAALIDALINILEKRVQE